jgi:hypothetical protein
MTGLIMGLPAIVNGMIFIFASFLFGREIISSKDCILLLRGIEGGDN